MGQSCQGLKSFRGSLLNLSAISTLSFHIYAKKQTNMKVRDKYNTDYVDGTPLEAFGVSIYNREN